MLSYSHTWLHINPWLLQDFRISPKFKNSEDGTLVSSTSHHHPPSLCRGNAPPPFLPPHTTYQLSTYNTAHTVYYVLDWCVELDWYMYWAGVLDWYGQSSTYNTPVQCIQHTSPVHTTHQSSTYNTPVQCIQHTSPVPTNTWMDGYLLK